MLCPHIQFRKCISNCPIVVLCFVQLSNNWTVQLKLPNNWTVLHPTVQWFDSTFSTCPTDNVVSNCSTFNTSLKVFFSTVSPLGIDVFNWLTVLCPTDCPKVRYVPLIGQFGPSKFGPNFIFSAPLSTTSYYTLWDCRRKTLVYRCQRLDRQHPAGLDRHHLEGAYTREDREDRLYTKALKLGSIFLVLFIYKW